MCFFPSALHPFAPTYPWSCKNAQGMKLFISYDSSFVGDNHLLLYVIIGICMVVTFQPVPIASAPDCVATSMSMEMWPWGGEMTGHYGFASRLSLSCWVCRVRRFDQIIRAWVSLGWLSACQVYIATIVGGRTFNSKIFPDFVHTLKLVNICVTNETNETLHHRITFFVSVFSTAVWRW